jgi:hypothetical protein
VTKTLMKIGSRIGSKISSKFLNSKSNYGPSSKSPEYIHHSTMSQKDFYSFMTARNHSNSNSNSNFGSSSGSSFSFSFSSVTVTVNLNLPRKMKNYLTLNYN